MHTRPPLRVRRERIRIGTALSSILSLLGRAVSRIPSRWRKIIAVTIGLLIGAGGLALSARGVDRSDLASAFEGVAWSWVGAAVVANVVHVVAQGCAWRIGLNAGGMGPVATRHAVAATWIGRAGNQLLPGKVGEIARVALIRPHLNHDHREVSRIAGSLVAQRALSFVATLGVIAAVSTVMPIPIGLPGGRWALPLILAGLVGTVGVLVVTRPLKLVRRSRSGRLNAILTSFVGGAALLKPSRDTSIALGLHMLAVSAQLIMLQCLLLGFGVAAPITAPLLIVALIALVGAVPGAPGGAGLQQAALVAPLGAAYGVSPSSALAFALGLQATVAVVALIGGVIAFHHHRRACAVRVVFP